MVLFAPYKSKLCQFRAYAPADGWLCVCKDCFMKSVTKKLLKDVPLKLLVVSLLFIAAVFVFGFLADEVVLEKEDLFDSRVFNFFQAFTTPGLISAASFFSFFGSSTFFLPAYVLLCGYFLWRKKKRLSLDILLVGISSTLLMFGLKNFFKRQRPNFPILQTLHNYSFPSGHALCSFVFCSIVVYVIWLSKFQKTYKWILSILLLAFAVAIGISRIILRYHYASDVIAGFSLGFAWVLFSLWLLNKISKRKKEAIAQ
jgi:undecaprenyl-diphosphatase